MEFQPCGRRIVFLGGKDYRRLFLELTANVQNERIVFYAGKKPSGSGCTFCTYRESYRNRNYRIWHYRCAEALMEGKIRLDRLTERGLSQSWTAKQTSMEQRRRDGSAGQ